MGLEPTRPSGHKILSLARLPVPTLPQARRIIAFDCSFVNKIFAYFFKKGN